MALPSLPSLKSLFGDPLGASKVVATNIVNKAEQLMIDNRDEYLTAEPNVANQAAALAYFDQQFEYMRVALTQNRNISGTTASISWRERDRGGVYDYPRRYRDPIANDSRLSSIERQTGKIMESLGAGFGVGQDAVMVGLVVFGAFVTIKLFRGR